MFNAKLKDGVLVVIGSAGIKSLAALPIIDFLLQNNVPIKRYIGSGAGAFLAALIITNNRKEDIPRLMSAIYNKQAMSDFNLNALLTMINFPFFKYQYGDGFLHNQRLLKLGKKFYGDLKIEDLPIPLEILTTDLITAESVMLDSGILYQALYASNALFPLFPPIWIQDKWLVDGSFTSILPILALNNYKFDLIVFINIDRCGEIHFENFAEFVCNTLLRTTAFAHMTERTLALDLMHSKSYYFTIAFEHRLSMWDEYAADLILDAGEIAMKEHGPQIMKILNI